MKRMLAWIVPVAAAAAVAPVARGDGGDAWMFTATGRTLLSSDWSHTFSNPGIQVGPLQLALFGSVGRSPLALAIVLGVAAALLVLAAARAAGVEQPRLLAVVGLVAVVTGIHARRVRRRPPRRLAPAAAVDPRRRGGSARPRVLAGAIVGLSAGFETWGILGVAVLALAPSVRDAARGLLVAVAAAAVLFLPFVAAGQFHMGGYRWLVSSQSLVSLVVAPGTAVGWPLRLLQGAVAVGAGVAVARAARGSRHAIWLVPGVVVLARLLLDPLDSGYYFVGIEGPALVGLALAAAVGLRLPGAVLPASRSRSAAFTAGQSSSITAYHAESRRSPPRTSMCLRNTPSNSAGSAASAARDRSFCESVLNSTRR